MIDVVFGLGNPGSQYSLTRHNVGFWYLDMMAEKYSCVFKKETKFHAEISSLLFDNRKVWLVKPQTFMNKSGLSVVSFCHFYRIPANRVLVVYDELDLPVGTVKLKKTGGHGGHNGLRDIIPHIGADFLRLRVGIGHPGDKSKVTPWVLGRPNQKDEKIIYDGLYEALAADEFIFSGDIEKAMLVLHTNP